MPIDQTHDPNLRSWVESANDPASDFPIQNLPLCVFMREHGDDHGHSHVHRHLGVRIGDQILDITMLAEAEYFSKDGDNELADFFFAPFWNTVASQPEMMPHLRMALQNFLRQDAVGGQQIRRLRQKCVQPAADLKLELPVAIFDYTDFYASKHHATNVGAMFRPDNPLLPNYNHIPIGYHGRASSVVPSGTEIRRPRGQQSPPDADPAAGPGFGPCKMLDYELELGLIVGAGNDLGEPIPMAEVSQQLFGMVLLNDWSARDMQRWEYQPLGPFLAKNFGTTISPLIVSMEALEPFRVVGPERDAGDPEPLPYLRSSDPWGYDIALEVHLQSQQMRERSMPPALLSKGNFKHMYWTVAQMLVHHASNGCNLKPGDVLGSGTISGPERSSRGCLLELTWDGIGADGKPKPRVPIQLPSGESRTFLADGDEIIMSAYCQKDGFRRIGFGECRGKIVPAVG